MPEFKVLDWATSTRDKALLCILIVSVLSALGTLGYAIAAPNKAQERFTEFYLLNSEGKAENYPCVLTVGKEGRVIVGIVNREHKPVLYRVEITIAEDKISEIAPVVLNHEQKVQQEIRFVPIRAGFDQKVEFLLYKGESAEPYQRLHLWIDVR